MTPFPGMTLGIVVASYPQGQSVDVLLPDSGSRLTNVQVMMLDGASDKSGTVDLPDPGLPADDTRWDLGRTAPNVIQAVIVSYKGIPFCIGFLMSQINQMTFDRQNFRVQRHISDVYSTIDEFGNTEYFHPSGSYARIGTSSAHEDLTGTDFDGLWEITKNMTAAVGFHAELQNNGVVKAVIDVDSNGDCTLTLAGNLTATVSGNLSATVNGGGGATLTAAHGINLNGVTIDSSGNLTSPATIKGMTDVITGANTSLNNHLTSGVSSGSSSSGPPVPGT